jgi:hypothetical protein
VETHKVFESQEFQSVSLRFKISGKENLRDASKALRKYAAEENGREAKAKGPVANEELLCDIEK